MNELIKINYEGDRQTTSARSLWEFLDKPYDKFTKWFNVYKEFDFVENQDFRELCIKVHTSNGAEHDAVDYEITTEMAKELSMLQKTDKGKQARLYFIELEKKWNSPESVMSRALEFARQTITKLQTETLETKPKAEYFDQLVDRNLLTNFRDTAKELKVKQNEFVDWLITNDYVYRDAKKKLKPYSQHVPKLFEIKESARGDWSGLQTLITPKGRETFRLLMSET